MKKASPATKVVIGGIHATILPTQTLKECKACDYVVIGEGEKTLLSLIESFNSKKSLKNIPNIAYRKDTEIVQTEINRNPIDINELPIPDYSLIKMELYIPHTGNYKVLPTYSFYASRGCAFPCTFCSANIVLGKRVRYKTIERAIEEIKVLVNKYNTKGLLFQDSTFTINKNWVKELCNRLIKEKIQIIWRANSRVDCVDEETLSIMKKAGCHRVNLGFESGNQKTLDFLKKKTTVEQNLEAAKLVTGMGMELGASFIIGLPNEGLNEVINTINFAKKIGSKFTQFYIPIPYPGTVLRNQCGNDVREDAPWEHYSSRDFSNPVYINKNFEDDIFKKLPEFASREFYCNLSVIWRIITNIKSFVELKDTVLILKEIFNKWRNFSLKKTGTYLINEYTNKFK